MEFTTYGNMTIGMKEGLIMTEHEYCRDCVYYKSAYEHSKICLIYDILIFPDRVIEECPYKLKINEVIGNE